MRVGGVYRWITNKAIGHEARLKYHVYICEPTWSADGHSFLLINKSDYGGDYKITNPPYNFLTLEYSYIGCSGLVSYTDVELEEYDIEDLGDIDPSHLVELRNTIAASELMVGRQIRLCCDVLKDFC